jgi:hypothetical protein
MEDETSFPAEQTLNTAQVWLQNQPKEDFFVQAKRVFAQIM